MLTGQETGAAPEQLARGLVGLGAGAALVKGGHGSGGSSDDVLLDSEGPTWFRAERVATPHTHGTGCTLSAAVAAHLALGATLREAVGSAKDYLTEALVSGATRQVGSGRGPVDHLVRLRKTAS